MRILEGCMAIVEPEQQLVAQHVYRRYMSIRTSCVWWAMVRGVLLWTR